MKGWGMIAGAVILVALLIGSSALYIVDVRDRAILLRLGEMRAGLRGPPPRAPPAA